jgi:hypothetical protein
MGTSHSTLDLLFDWFGLVCFESKNKNSQQSYSRFQASQTGGQWYSYTSPFSIPWSKYHQNTAGVPIKDISERPVACTIKGLGS